MSNNPTPRYVYHVYATRQKDGVKSVFSGTVSTSERVIDDHGFNEIKDVLTSVLDANQEAKATEGAFLTVKSLSYLGESS